jgi:hypothetical protein
VTDEHRGGGGKHERKYGVCGQPTIELRGWHEGWRPVSVWLHTSVKRQA